MKMEIKVNCRVNLYHANSRKKGTENGELACWRVNGGVYMMGFLAVAGNDPDYGYERVQG